MLSYLIYYLVPAATMMIVFLSWTLTRSVKARTGIDVTIVLFLLITMVAMLVGPVYLYLSMLSLTIGDVAIWEIAVFMSAGMMPIGVLLFAKFWMEGDTERRGPLPLENLLRHVSYLRFSYIGLVVASEFLMGWSFNFASGLISLSRGYSVGTVASQIGFTLASYWFVFTMAGEMALTLLAFRRIVRPALRDLLALQAIVMFLTPTAFASLDWEAYALYAEAAAMTVVVVFAILQLRRRGERDHSFLVYTVLFIVANAGMMAGFLWWLVSGSAYLLGAGLIVESMIYFDGVLTGAGIGESFRGTAPLSSSVPPPALGNLPLSVAGMGGHARLVSPALALISSTEVRLRVEDKGSNRREEEVRRVGTGRRLEDNNRYFGSPALLPREPLPWLPTCREPLQVQRQHADGRWVVEVLADPPGTAGRDGQDRSLQRRLRGARLPGRDLCGEQCQHNRPWQGRNLRDILRHPI
ncbi:MAG: hypothetical protein JRN09_05715 [Nitrososphaerota archaeon]|nr:hypothetical protein [Nitrososphaerota archaeon]